MRYLTLLTGPRGSGKTSRCARFVAQAREKELDPGGLLSPALFHNGKKIGIDLLNIATGEQRPLARRCTQPSQGIQLGDWCFDPSTLHWGNQILRSLKNRELILMDELGPLEFEKGIGLIAGLELIDGKMFHQAIVVIRPKLLQPAQYRWPEAEVVDVSCAESQLRILEKGIA